MTGEGGLPDWEARFRAPRVTLPDWAPDAPDRCLLGSDASGTFELWAWDAATGSLRQATDREHGTLDGAVDRDGTRLWWFDDSGGDEKGTWQVQPFGGGADEPALPGVPRAYDAGLALGPGGLVVVASSGEDGSGDSVVRVGTPGALRELYRSADEAGLGALSHDGSIVVVSHSERGDSRNPALRAYRVADGEPVGDLDDGPGQGLAALGFAPVAGDTRLLVGHERRGRDELLLWDVATGEVRELDVPLPGSVSADWYADGRALLLVHDHEGRAALHRLDLATGAVEALPTPPGTVTAATARPDGSVWYSWSSAAEPPVVRDLATGAVVLAPPAVGDEPVVAPPSRPVQDVWVDGPGGRVHALLSVPASGAAPYPLVVHVHGGPEAHDRDAWRADVAAWLDHGYAVVRVNYRGSDGYGSAWTDAIVGRVGLTELEDLAAVRERLVADGVADPARVLLTGGSWGGYLTLLGLGVQPDLWAAGVAVVPVADYVTAYEDEMEALQSYDRALFGGSPAEVPTSYAQSNPLAYVGRVRVPVLVLVGENDPRCPARQVDVWLAAARAAGRVEPEEHRFDAGHGSLVVEQRVEHMRLQLAFAQRHVPTG